MLFLIYTFLLSNLLAKYVQIYTLSAHCNQSACEDLAPRPYLPVIGGGTVAYAHFSTRNDSQVESQPEVKFPGRVFAICVRTGEIGALARANEP